MELQLDKKEKYLFIETFGCQMNENDSEKVIGLLRHLNYKTTDSPDKADIVILNTCSIRDKAEQKVYSALGRLKKLKRERPALIIGVGGCVAQQEGGRLLKRVPHLDVVFGTHNIHRLPDLIKEVETARSRLVATEFFNSIEDEESFDYAYIKDDIEHSSCMVKASVTIMRGCNNFCSYCIVPYVRGREMSRKSGDILQEAKKLVKAGVKEITLVGQNVNSYGNNGTDISFPELLRRVCRVDGIERVRFITSHPKDMSEELIQLFGEEEKLCRHMHLPLQSGSQVILERMNRGYTKDDYLGKIVKLKMLSPDMAITTDIIVGFPGETESDFLGTMSLIKEIEFDNIFSFKYSPRQETMAASFGDQILEGVKEERLIMLQEAQKEITLHKNQKMIGKIVNVLIEGKSKTTGMASAALNGVAQLTSRTSCNKVVNLSADKKLMGRLVAVKIMSASPNALFGFLVQGENERVDICY